MKLLPLSDRVVVKPVDAEEITPGGIVIPSTAQEAPTEAVVVAVGEGRLNDDRTLVPMMVKVGQTVIYGKYAGAELERKGEKVVILKETDILAILEKE